MTGVQTCALPISSSDHLGNQRGTIDLVAGQEYHVELRQSLDLISSKASPFLAAAAFRIGAYPKVSAKDARDAAVELAKKSESE